MCDKDCKCDNENLDKSDSKGLSVESTEECDLDPRFLELEYDKELDRLSCLVYIGDEIKSTLSQSDEFQKGVTESLALCGLYSSLISFGFPEDKAYELTINHQISSHNLVMAKENNRASIEISKNTAIAMEKTQL